MSGPMIAADAGAAFAALSKRLAERARLLAKARLATRRLAAARNETRWRRADLVWPLFAKG